MWRSHRRQRPMRQKPQSAARQHIQRNNYVSTQLCLIPFHAHSRSHRVTCLRKLCTEAKRTEIVDLDLNLCFPPLLATRVRQATAAWRTSTLERSTFSNTIFAMTGSTRYAKPCGRSGLIRCLPDSRYNPFGLHIKAGNRIVYAMHFRMLHVYSR